MSTAMEDGKLTIQSEASEKRLVVEWPDRDILMTERDRFIAENMEVMKSALRKDYLLENEEESEKLSRFVLGAKFMFIKMCQISPLPLLTPFKIIENFEYRKDQALFGVNKRDDNDCMIYVDSFWQAMSIGAKDLDIIGMSGAVHEFAHMLYKGKATQGQIPSKVSGWEEKEKRKSSDETETDAYLSTDPEIRARVWELTFLKKYFPDSDLVEKVRDQLKRGMQIRMKRRGRD